MQQIKEERSPAVDTLVSELLEQFPYLVDLFLEHRLDCLGCVMARFCTLEEVSGQYELNLNQFIQQIEERIKDNESDTDLN